MRGKRAQSGTSNSVRVRRGQARVWFYRNRNESSIDVYVRPAASGQNQPANGPAPICFRISARDFIGW
jgi:hypothetical protein